MTNEILVANVEQVPFGEGRMFSLGGEDKIAVFRTREGNVHATQPFCPHLGGPLADGLMSATAVVCPLHDRTFDLASGCGLTHEHMDIKVFQSRVDTEGNVWVVPDSVPARQPIHVGANAHLHAASESMEVIGSA